MDITEVWDCSVRVGFVNRHVRLGVQYNWAISTSGSDIRRNDMPFPGNRMDRQSVGVSALWWTPWIKGLAIHAMGDQVVAGRNIGKSFTWMGGVQYVFKPFQKKKNEQAEN